ALRMRRNAGSIPAAHSIFGSVAQRPERRILNPRQSWVRLPPDPRTSSTTVVRPTFNRKVVGLSSIWSFSASVVQRKGNALLMRLMQVRILPGAPLTLLRRRGFSRAQQMELADAE